MPKLPNIDEIVSMYWEADRAKVKKRYEELFGATSESLPSEEDVSQEENSDEPFNEESSSESEPSDEITFDDELLDIIAEADISDPIRELMVPYWSPLDARSQVIILHYLNLLVRTQNLGFHAAEGLIHFLGAEAASHLCHCLQPDAFFPIGLESSYLQLHKTFEIFGIEFDDTKNLDQFEVWLNISNAVGEYRDQARLEHWQIWALIYDLGPRLLPKAGPYPSNPPPRIWVAATNDSYGEFEKIDNHGSENVGAWAINKQARRGDIALMYCVSPRSAVVSVYRLACDAHYDPFGGWNGYRGELTDKIAVPWIQFSEMKKDEILSQWRLVKGNFQGLLQNEVPQEAWQRIKELVGKKDSEAAERLAQYANAGEGVRMIKVSTEQWSEFEVEEKLVVPVLTELGWKIDKTLDRQTEMTIKVGSGQPKKVLADFVGYKSNLGSDPLMVVETKRKINTAAKLREAVEQAESYAGKLRCARFAVASPEGFWVYDLQFPGQSTQLATIELSAGVSKADIEKLKPLIGFDALIG